MSTYTQYRPGTVTEVTLTEEQDDAREAFKAHVAAQMMGREWQDAMRALTRDGNLSHSDAEDILWGAVNDLVEDGVDDYR